MLRFSANISTLFSDLPIPERISAASKAGFTAIECQVPYAFRKEMLAELIKENDLEFTLFNVPPGNREAGERGIACLPDRIEEYRRGVEISIEYAKVLQCRRLCVPSGILSEKLDVEDAHDCFVENLKFTTDLLEKNNIITLIEPINIYDIPGIFLSSITQALSVLDEVGSKNLFIEYDVYHMYRMGQDIETDLLQHMRNIANIQIADYPGHKKPGTGEINFRGLFKLIDKSPYKGWVGCEFDSESINNCFEFIEQY